MTTISQSIIPHIWYDKEAVEAARFYASVFLDSRVTGVTTLHDTPSGDCDQVSFEIWGQKFMAISAGPYFKLNRSVSFFVNFDPSRDKDAAEKIDEVWNKLSEGDLALMLLDKYPFSERYGWIQDKYGVSWKIVPAEIDEMMEKGTPEQLASVTKAFLTMKKFNLAALQQVFKEA